MSGQEAPKSEVNCVRIVQAKSRVTSCRSVEIVDYRTPTAKAKAGTRKTRLKACAEAKYTAPSFRKRGKFAPVREPTAACCMRVAVNGTHMHTISAISRARIDAILLPASRANSSAMRSPGSGDDGFFFLRSVPNAATYALELIIAAACYVGLAATPLILPRSIPPARHCGRRPDLRSLCSCSAGRACGQRFYWDHFPLARLRPAR